jgi:hypothetical protein
MKLVRLIKMYLIETYSKICIGKSTSASFPIQTGLKQRDALSPLLFNFVLQHAMRKVQKIQEGMELNGTNSSWSILMMLSENTKIIKKNKETLLEANREAGLEVKSEKNEHMITSCHKKLGKKS